MEDLCAVCAEPLEWVGYGKCDHQDVCSKCIARLRFVLCDKQCCICKQDCPSVFVTKALGDYTKSVDSFESLAGRKDLWFESNIQAYFDDEEQYKMVKAMFRLSCNICEQAESPGKNFVKKGYVFRNLDLLHRHLFNAHKVQMCGLCLEGRKIFICEQKLYSKKQLERHLMNGDSEIDGNDEHRGGFTGHPLCNFCHARFYGDNELYQHMSTEHFTCHICQRLHPGQYDYYRNYDDLEAHFRHKHALCEHADCLAQKFVVFNSDAELKRHNALVHGGNMSRSQRNAALQIPVSFQYRRGPGEFPRRGRASRLQEGYSDGLLGSQGTNQSTQESSLLEVNSAIEFPHFQQTQTVVSELPLSSRRAAAAVETANTIAESSRYRAAVSGAGPSSLRESAFPPLPGSESTPRNVKQHMRRSAFSMASLLTGEEGTSRSQSNHGWMPVNVREVPSVEPSHVAASDEWPQASVKSSHSDTEVSRKSTVRQTAEPFVGKGSSSLIAAGETSSIPLSLEELRMANKALIESIRSELKGDEERFNEFKIISAQFRSGDMGSELYIDYIQNFGLLHVVPELARLCPDAKKKDDLLKALNRVANKRQMSNDLKESLESFPSLKDTGESSGNGSHKGNKMKSVAVGQDESLDKKDTLIYEMNKVNVTDKDEEVEVLSKDGYRGLRGKASLSNSAFRNGRNYSNVSKGPKVLVKATNLIEQSSMAIPPDIPPESNPSIAFEGLPVSTESQKKKKKKQGVVKIRLGDGSAALHLDSKRKAWG